MFNSDDQAKQAVNDLIEYCKNTGCFYCPFRLFEIDVDRCAVRFPRDWDTEKTEE